MQHTDMEVIDYASFLKPTNDETLSSALLPILAWPEVPTNINEKGNKLAGVSHIIAFSDLQGVVRENNTLIPLTIDLLRNVLPLLVMEGKIPPLHQCICLVAGDSFANTNDFRRGTDGFIDDVIEEFIHSDFFATAMVLGNHDLVSEDVNAQIQSAPNFVLLDGDVMNVAGLNIGGVSGIVGNPTRPNRNSESMLCKKIASIARQTPDILLLHEGPYLNEEQKGHLAVTKALKKLENCLVISGHIHWKNPIAQTTSNHILNVDERVVVMAL